MKKLLFKTALLSLAFTGVLTSCNNKVEDTPEQFARGGNNLTMTDDGNLVIAGYNTSSTYGYQAALVKVNSTTGDTIWSKMYGGSYSDAFFNVIRSRKNDGGYVATGFSNKANGGSPSLLVVMADAAGKQSKFLTYASNSYSEGMSIVSNADSGYLVGGFIQKTSTSDRDLYLLRLRDDGTVIWEKSIGAKSSNNYDKVNDAIYGIVADPAGGYFLTGSMNGGYSMEDGKIFLMKIAANGDSLWTKTYGTGFGYSLTLTSDGGIAICGSVISASGQDAFLLKTDKNGNLLWPAAKTFGSTGYQYGASMVQTSDGGFAFTGISEESNGLGLHDVYFVRTNASGDKTWEKVYGGSDNDQGYGIVQSSDGNFYITGLTNSGGSYIFLNKVDNTGAQVAGWPKNIR